MKVGISNSMFISLIINLVYAKGIGLTQGSMAREVGSDMWIATLFSAIQGALIMLLTVYIIRKAPKFNIFEQSELLLGKWFGKIICVIAFCFFLGASGAVFITFVYHLKDYFLPEAPIVIFVIAGLIMGVFALYHGIEVIGRLAIIGIFSVTAFNVILFMGSVSNFDIRELMPVFRHGFVPTLWASRFNNTDWAMATMMAAILLPIVNDKQQWGKSAPGSILLGFMIVVIWPFLEAGVLTPEVTAQYIVSCMQMARSAEIGLFIHRYEMIMVALFAISVLSQIMITFYCASVSIQKLFGFKKVKPVIIPVSMIVSAFGYWVVLDHQRAINYLETSWVTISQSIGFGLPVSIAVLGFFFRKKLKANNMNQSPNQ
jgi:spore germination protein KB